MTDQADQLRRLVREAVQQNPSLQPLPPLAAISGGLRGAGATTIACLTAAAMARLGKRVLLIDADVVRPAVAARMKLDVGSVLGDVLSGRRRLTEAAACADANLWVLAGQAAADPPPVGDAARQRLLAELAAGRDTFDFVMIDAGMASTPWSDWLWQISRQVLLATTATPADLRASYAAVKLSRETLLGDGRLRLAVRTGGQEGSAARAAEQFRATSECYLGLTLGKASLLPAHDRSDAFREAVLTLAADLLSFSTASCTRFPSGAGRRVGSRLAARATAGEEK